MNIKTDGTIKDIKPSKGKTFTLSEMQELVNGMVQLINLSKHKVYMLINEEGKLLSLPDNDAATALWEEEFGKDTGDYIVGDVAIIQYSEIS